MNWVGGARSRVRQHAEKKVQKEFFERRRLAGKVQRIKPSLSKVKTAVSQDLLFLKATASATKSKPLFPGHAARMPKPLNLERGGKDRLSMRPQRDMELPMSPIDRASSLDLMDTTATNATFLSEALAEQGVSGDGRGLKEPPRVSTQKIPHQTILDSFGPPRINDFDLHPHTGQDHDHRAVPMEDSHLLNVSTMTESLFPPPAKRHKELNMETGRSHGAKKYSLDDMLKQNHPLSERPSQAPKGVPVFPGPKHGKVKRHASDQAQNKLGSIFAIAKGGWRGAEKKQEPQREKKRDAVGYQFNFERPGYRDAPGMEIAATGDHDAMLELHYATERVKERSYDAEPSTVEDDQLIPTYEAPTMKHLGWKGKSKLDDESRQQDILPWLSSTKSVSSELSEDPFSGRKIPHLFAGPPVSTSVDFNESVFGPLRHRDANGRGHSLHHDQGQSLQQEDKSLHCKEHPVCHQKRHRGDATGPSLAQCTTSFDTTQYNESILAPIRNAKKGISTTREDADESILAPLRAARKRGFHELIHPKKVDQFIPDMTRSKASLYYPVGVGVSTPTRKSIPLDQVRVGETLGTPAPILTGTPLARGGMGHRTPAKKNGRPQVSELVTTRGKSTFETMMASLEKPSVEEEGSEVVEVIRGSPTFNSKGSHVQLEVYHVSDKHKRPPSYLSYECDDNASLPDSEVSALPHCTASNGPGKNSKCTARPGNISVLHELMSLEEEIASHYEDGLLSQCSTEEIGENSEDPLFQRAHGGNQKIIINKNKLSSAGSQELAMTKSSDSSLTKQAHSTGHTLQQDSSSATSLVAVGELELHAVTRDNNGELKLASSDAKPTDKAALPKEVPTVHSSSSSRNSISASTTGTQTRSQIPDCASRVTKGIKTFLDSRASTGVQTDVELVCSSTQTSDSIDAKPDAVTSDNEVAASAQSDGAFASSSAQTAGSVEDHSEALSGKNNCSSTQTSDFIDAKPDTMTTDNGCGTDGGLVSSSAQTPGFIAAEALSRQIGSDASDSDPSKGCSSTQTLNGTPNELGSEASSSKCITESNIKSQICSPVQTPTCIEAGYSNTKLKSSATNMNLTIGLEKYRMTQREMCRSCDAACQTCGEAEFAEAHGANLTAAVELKEVERLWQRVKELEAHVERAESTIVWQSVILKCLRLDSQ